MPITPQEALQRTIEHREIFHDEMVELMRQIMRGEVSQPMVSAILTGLRVKKETIGEIAAAASVLREFSHRVEVPDRDRLVDIVGTGGDGAHTFNISTASMFVVAAAGAKVAKHGNRRNPAAPMYSKRWARRSSCSPNRSRPASRLPVSVSCSRRCTTRR
jgi:anthranilate phosphoribosyltransferase